MKIKIALGADHAGYEYKDKLISLLENNGFECTDCGTNGPESVDYPIYADKVCKLVNSGECKFGILVYGNRYEHGCKQTQRNPRRALLRYRIRVAHKTPQRR